MNEMPTEIAPGCESILAGGHVALRYNIVPPAHWYGGSASPDSWLDLVHQELQASKQAAACVKELASFYSDVTIPFTRREQLPVGAMVEPSLPPRLMEIDIASVRTKWEDHVVIIPPATLTVQFRDAVALFESGHFIYTPSFLLQAPAPDNYGRGFVSEGLKPIHVSALTSLVSTPSVGYGQSHDALRKGIRFRLVGGDGEWRELIGFINARMAVLAAPDSENNVFADLIRPVLGRAGWSEDQRDEARASISALKWRDVRSASVEVVGAGRHDDIVAWCRAAASDRLQAGDDERAIAALSQNILDVVNQDDGELADSLSQALILNNEVLLIHPKMTLRYSRSGRPFMDMRDVIGGCPYFMLTNVVLAYNEYLLDLSAKLIDRIQQSLRKPDWAKADAKTDMAKAAEDLAARVKLFEHQTLHALPNIFRYPTERAMFDEIVRQRGLDMRAEGIDRFTHSLYELREDITDLAERRGTRRTNRLLLALSIIQVSGLVLAFLGLEELKLFASTAGLPRLILLGLFVALLISGAFIALRALRDK